MRARYQNSCQFDEKSFSCGLIALDHCLDKDLRRNEWHWHEVEFDDAMKAKFADVSLALDALEVKGGRRRVTLSF